MESDLKLPSGLEMARKMSLKSDAPFPLGSVLINGGRVVGKGYNKYSGYNPMVRKYFKFPTLHAEIMAISNTPPDLVKGSTIYVYRRRFCGTPGVALCCYRCMRAVRDLGIRKIVYSIPDFPYYQELKIR